MAKVTIMALGPANLGFLLHTLIYAVDLEESLTHKDIVVSPTQKSIPLGTIGPYIHGESDECRSRFCKFRLQATFLDIRGRFILSDETAVFVWADSSGGR